MILVYKEQDDSLPFLNYLLPESQIMKKLQKRALVLTIIVMLCTSQLSVTYSFGETEKNPEKRMQNTSKDAQNDDFKVLSAEKVVNNNFKTQYNSVRNNSSIENEETRFSSEGQISNQVQKNLNSLNSGIILFDSNFSKFTENFFR